MEDETDSLRIKSVLTDTPALIIIQSVWGGRSLSLQTFVFESSGKRQA